MSERWSPSKQRGFRFVSWIARGGPERQGGLPLRRIRRVKRGDQLMAYSDAKIAKGERISVLMNMSTKNSISASELRLAPIGQLAAATPDPHAGHQMTGQKPMDMPMPSSAWSLMQDGVVYGLFNHQGGPRGGDEFVVPNWWMGMLDARQGPAPVRPERDVQPRSPRPWARAATARSFRWARRSMASR